MCQFWRKLKEETAGAMVENVIVLPLVFVIIIFMIVSAFLLHDRTTIEAAARRGATYGAHCINDPNYATLVGQHGELDIPEDKDLGSLPFSSIGKNIKAYRYLVGGNNVEDVVKSEVLKIVANTRINWVTQDSITVTCSQENKIIYQDLTVSVKATYKLPQWFELFGLTTEYTMETTAKIAATEPDEFIRNADMVVDLITEVDNALFGGGIQKTIEKIGQLGNKLQDWLAME